MSLSRKLRFVLSFYGLMAEVRVEPYMEHEARTREHEARAKEREGRA
jgi:hypothetical protein